MTKKRTNKKAAQQIVFTKDELLSATNLTGSQRDLLEVALDPGKTYTVTEAKSAVTKLKGGLF